MLVPIKWLREYTDVNVSDEEWVNGMVLSGTNLESVEYWHKEISGVVVGRIEKIEPHPNASKLVVCQVNVGKDEPVQIVTGAANMKEGDKVVVALDGAHIPGPLHGKPKSADGETIRAGELRGVESRGMMCGCQELGFPDKIVPVRDKDGLWILDDECFVPGTPIVEALGIEEPTVDFEITPNRPDCLAMLGIARESAATFGTELRYPETRCTKESPERGEDHIQVEIRRPDLCSRFCCRVIKDIKIEQSPWWMQRSLMLAGMRPINNIVDITNYVMLEYGQPLHAYDIRTVKGGKIIVDTAKDGDKFTTLDGVERQLDSSILMINDAERPLGIAGIMGGLDSEIESDTTMVLVESANFSGDCVRAGSRKLNHRTEASGRFEKGIDPNLAKEACDRFCYLVEKLGAGTVLSGGVDCYPHPAEPVVTKIRASRMNKVIGIDIPTEQMVKYLNRLEIKTEVDGDVITCTAPTVRQDLHIEEDYVEEIARMYGYDRIPVTLPKGSVAGGLTQAQKYRNMVKDTLRALGCSEIMTYSFVSPKSVDKVNERQNSFFRQFVKLINPLGEDTSVMRTMLLPGMMEVLYTNMSRNIPAVRFFELGNTFIDVPSKSEPQLPTEKYALCIGMFGPSETFYTLKGVIEQLLAAAGIKAPEYRAEKFDKRFHPGRCAAIESGIYSIGTMGQVHPEVCAAYGIDQPVYAAEIDFDMMAELADTEVRYAPLPKFPAMSRDFAMVVKEEIEVGKLQQVIRETAGDLLESVTLFDVYRGLPIPKGSKSVAFNLSYRAADRTLKEAEVSEINTKVLAALKDKFDAVLREM
ncbi:MAG: phenylalanine--tRNA ligase subunit beta [Firmicutes bacterium]|nr:phenylalanine--tRNA ligase subunit beta [Bacillota bacterium]